MLLFPNRFRLKIRLHGNFFWTLFSDGFLFILCYKYGNSNF